MPSLYKFLSLVALMCVLPHALGKDRDDDNKPEVTIIQERLFDKKREVGIELGYIPDDNFYEVYPLTVSFTHHFNERYAWEVIRASQMITKDRDIKADLEDNFGVTPSTFDEFNNHIETSFVIKPTYGKDSLWNKRVINHEGYISFGAGIATFEKQVSYGNQEKQSAMTASIAIGRKYFINRSFNISLTFKDMLVFKELNTENYIYLGVGFNYRFDLFGSMKKQRSEDNSIYDYLK